jgi:hypothetical protein
VFFHIARVTQCRTHCVLDTLKSIVSLHAPLRFIPNKDCKTIVFFHIAVVTPCRIPCVLHTLKSIVSLHDPYDSFQTRIANQLIACCLNRPQELHDSQQAGWMHPALAAWLVASTGHKNCMTHSKHGDAASPCCMACCFNKPQDLHDSQKALCVQPALAALLVASTGH